MADSLEVVFEPGGVDLSVSGLSVDEDTVTADGVDEAVVTVVVRDAQGNEISGGNVEIEATGSGNVYDQPVGPTGVDGVAEGAVRSTVAELKYVKARIDGQYMADSLEVVFEPGGVDHFIITHDGSATAGMEENVTVDVRDIFDNRILTFEGLVELYTDTDAPGDRISWGLGTAAGTIQYEDTDTLGYQFSTADNGIATLGFTDLEAETISIFASFGAVTSASGSSLVVGSSSADSIFVIEGYGQRAVVNSAVPDPLVVGVEDEFGNRVSGVTVSYAVVDGGGYIDTDLSVAGQQTTSVTDVSGETFCEHWRLGTVSGFDSDRVSAYIPSGSTTSVSFIATTDHDSLDSIVLTPGTRNVTVNSPTVVTATLRDEFGNLVVGENLTVYIKNSPANGNLSADTSNPNPTTSLGPSIRSGTSDSTGTITVVYNAPGTAGLVDSLDANHVYLPADDVDDVVYTTIASGATDLRVTVVSGETSQAGESFSFIVEAVDGNGNLDPLNGSHLILTPPTEGGFTFSLTDFGASITETDLSGGTVTLYGRGSTTGSWQIDATASSPVLSPTDFTIYIIPNDTVDHYSVSTSDTVGADEEITLYVEARDRFDNLAAGASYDIDLRAVQAVDSSLAASDALSISEGIISNGIYSESNIRYLTAERIRIEVSDDSTSVMGYSGIITIDHAPAYRIVKISGDSTGVAAGDSVPLSARVLDYYDNRVNEQTVSFTVQEGNGGLAATQRSSDTDGEVSVMLGTGTVAGTNRIRAAILDGSPEGLETQTFEITTIPRDSVAYVDLAVGGTSFVAGQVFDCEIDAFDVHDNLITTDSSTRLVPVSEFPSIVFNPDTVTLSAGEASFTAYDTVMGTNRIAVVSLSGDTLAPWSQAIGIDHAPAFRITEVSGDTTGVISGESTELKARVRDVFGNPVDQEIVYFNIISDLGGTPSLWDGNGDPNDGITATGVEGSAVCSLTTDTNAGDNIVSASILDGDPPSRERVEFSVGTSAGSISRYVILPDGYTKRAGESFNVGIIAYDLNDNIAYGDDTTIVELGSDGSAAFSDNPVQLSNGSAVVVASENASGPLVLNARTQGGGAYSESDTVTIEPEDPFGTIAMESILPDTITANGTSRLSITTLPITDAYGNVVSVGNIIAVIPERGRVTSDDMDPLTPDVVERETGIYGKVSVFIESSTETGVDSVYFSSREGSADGYAVLFYAPPPSCAYGGYLSPRIVVPGEPVQFRCSLTNSSVTGLYLDAESGISFSDSIGNRFDAELGSSVFIPGMASDTLVFTSEPVPPGLLGGYYTPRVLLTGTDIHNSTYEMEFDAGSNSVAVSSIEIVNITPHKSIVSRGDTSWIDVELRNAGGGITVIQDIHLNFGVGNYSSIGLWDPAPPDSLQSGTSRTYVRRYRVLPNCPTGYDTIDAEAYATLDGTDIYDYSADANRATWLVQSAASIAYIDDSMEPIVVSSGQNQIFKLDLSNNGEAAVILSGTNTNITFTDGSETYSASLGSEKALPGQTVTEVEFQSQTVPHGMAAGIYAVDIALFGMENGAGFDTVITIGDSVSVVTPADLEYVEGTLDPLTVSRGSSVSFELAIRNTGGGEVVLDPDSTWITFSDGSTDYIALLDADRGRTAGPGETALYWESVTVPENISTGGYSALVHLQGEENGIYYETDMLPGEAVTVQDPPRLAINSIDIQPGDRITADQETPWSSKIFVQNNGQATVRLDSLKLGVFAGLEDVENEYVLTYIDFDPGVDSLNGGQQDSFTVTFEDDDQNAMTTGTVIVEATIWGTDLNSSDQLVATTDYGGKGIFLVQTPADIVVEAVGASVAEATVLQTRDWQVEVVLENLGESDVELELAPDSTYLTFSTSGDFLVISPVELAGGGIVLEGESADTLLFTVDRTGSLEGVCTLNAVIAGREINSGRILPHTVAEPGATSDALIQSQAEISITDITALQDPVTVGQERDWTIELSVENGGGSDLTLNLDRTDSTWVHVPDGTGFNITNPIELLEGGLELAGGGSGTLHFTVETTGDIQAGSRSLAGALLGEENNSGRVVFNKRESTDYVSFELPPAPQYVQGSLMRPVVSSGTAITIEFDVSSADPLHSTLILDPDMTRASFKDSEGDSFVTFLSQASGNELAGGSTLTLLFNTGIVDTAISRQDYTIEIHLEGTENGNDFSTDITSSPDLLTVEEAPQLSIQNIETPASVTRSLQPEWEVRMVLQNNGEASVSVYLDQLNTNISFTIIGSGDRTGEYTIGYPTALQESGTDTLGGGLIDTLVFAITETGSTSGTALVNGTVTAVDVNSGSTIHDDTYGGGYNMEIQEPGNPEVSETAADWINVTSGQVTPWRITLGVCNAGEAALTLVMDSTFVYYDASGALQHVPPTEFDEGGLDLEEGECKHLTFSVSPTPEISGGADLVLNSRIGMIEDNRLEYMYYDTGEEASGQGAIRVQAPADIHVAYLANDAHRPPFVNTGQRFPVAFGIVNTGEAGADSISVTLTGSGSSGIDNSPVIIESLEGSGSAGDTFFVIAAGQTGTEVLDADIVYAIDGNSGESSLVVVSPPIDDTTSVVIQNRSAVSILSVTPSQSEVNAGQSTDWTVRLNIGNDGGAPATLEIPSEDDVRFFIGFEHQDDYLVIPPTGFESGLSGMTLYSGMRDSLLYTVTSTGIDTGSVDIRASIAWSDGNQPELGELSVERDSTVHVKQPSGLRIIEVTSNAPNNGTPANTSIVNTDQVFQVSVVIENTGGDDLDSVLVRLTPQGSSSTAVQGDSLRVLTSGSQDTFIFDVTASSNTGNEILSASIAYAVSVNTGERVLPIEAVESVENLEIQHPASLSCGIAVTGPAGAVDRTLSTGQSFVVTAMVVNSGEAEVGSNGEMTLALPPGVGREYPSTEPLVRTFMPGDAISWGLIAPVSVSLDTIRVTISGIPIDINIDAPADVAGPEAEAIITTEQASDITGCALAVVSPAGAVDGILSTGQEFDVEAYLTPSANADSIWVRISVPASFSVDGPDNVFIGGGTGDQDTVSWTLHASGSSAEDELIGVSSGGKDMNSGIAFDGCSDELLVSVEEKARLDLSAEISGPAQARDGEISVNLPFTIEAVVENLGEAGVDTTGARVEITLPDEQGYMLNGGSETFKKTFYPGVPVVWSLRAPTVPTSPADIVIGFAEPMPRDMNSNTPVGFIGDEVSIPVQTVSEAIIMSNISVRDSIPPYVVPRGSRGVPVLRASFDNESGYTIGLDTLYLSIEPGRESAVSEVELEAGGRSYRVSVNSRSTVPIPVDQGLTIDPGVIDTVLIKLDIAGGASQGGLRVEIARSDDVVFSIGGTRSPVSAEDGGDIAGKFVSGPLQIMSSNFEEFAHNYPNPFRAGEESTRISYFLTEDADVSIRIYDLAGSLVWTKDIRAGEPGGTYSEGGEVWVEWNGRNDQGNLVRNGVYLCLIRAGSKSATFKIAVAK